MAEIMMKNFVIAGEIDHGKSTLIGRLLFETDCLPEKTVQSIRERMCSEEISEVHFSHIMDQLEEEQTQRITIDTAEIQFHSDAYYYNLIDTPGHLTYFKNMVTGASRADFAILLVDAYEGIQPQTHRHLSILKLMNIPLIIVVNKMDKISYSQETFGKLEKSLKNLLEQYSLSQCPICPISALQGENLVSRSSMPWLQSAPLLQLMDEIQTPKSQDAPLRLPVQAILHRQNQTYYLARIEQGELKAEKAYKVFQGSSSIFLKEIYSYQKDCIQQLNLASQGRNIAFHSDQPLERGDVIFDGDAPKSLTELKAHLFWMDDDLKSTDFQHWTLKIASQRSEVEFKNILETIDFRQERTPFLKLGDLATVVLKLKNPIFYDLPTKRSPLSRFVIEQAGKQVAGGIVCS